MKKSAILALLMVLLIAFSACGDKSSDKKDEEATEASRSASSVSDILIAYNKAYMDKDAEELYSYIPQFKLDYEVTDKSDAIDIIADEIEDYSEYGIERKIENIEKEKVDKDIVDQWNTYLAEYSDYANYYDEDKHKVTEAYIVDFDFVEYEDGEKTDMYSVQAIIIKENGEWKLLHSDCWSTDDYGFDWNSGIEDDYEDDYYDDYYVEETTIAYTDEEVEETFNDLFSDDYYDEDYYDSYDYY